MSLRRRQGAQSLQKRGGLWVERYNDVRTTSVYVNYSFAFARKQSLLTALLYYKLNTALL